MHRSVLSSSWHDAIPPAVVYTCTQAYTIVLQVRNWFQGLGYGFEADGAQTIYSWLLELVSIRFAKTVSRQGDATMHSLADVVTAAGHYALHQVTNAPALLPKKIAYACRVY